MIELKFRANFVYDVMGCCRSWFRNNIHQHVHEFFLQHGDCDRFLLLILVFLTHPAVGVMWQSLERRQMSGYWTAAPGRPELHRDTC